MNQPNIDMPQKAISTDLQIFIEKFEPSKFKTLASGIEVRGINNIALNITRANELIEKLKLNLKINHTADMLMYGAFEVKQRE